VEVIPVSIKSNIEPQNTDADGFAQFNLIENNFYNISVSASEYIPIVKSLSISKSNNPLTIEIFKPNASIIGKVKNSDGNPVNSAIVQLGTDFAITDSNGIFEIYTLGSGSLQLSISKMGFEISKYNINVEKKLHKDIGSISLKSTNLKPSILFETSKNPLGISKDEYISRFKDLSDFLIQSGFDTEFNDIGALKDSTDIVVITSPSLEYNENELKTLTDFVKKGKKVIVLGEWGGFGNFNINTANKFLANANLKINQDLVKETSKLNYQTSAEQVIISNFANNSITENIKNIVLYGSSSVDVLSGGINPLETNITKLIAFSSINSFRIKSSDIFKSFTEQQNALVAVSNIGLGKVIAMGDVSFLTNQDSNDDKTINLLEKDNKQFILNILNW